MRLLLFLFTFCVSSCFTQITQLRIDDCGRHILASYNDPFTFPLLAELAIADSWDFQIRNVDDINNIEDVFGLPNRTFQLIMVENDLFHLYNREYQIRVRTVQGGVLQSWGGWCSVFTPLPLSVPQFPDLTSISSAGRTVHNSYANSNLYILNNIGETITETYTLYPGPGNGNPQTGSKILNQGFEQRSKWSVSKVPPKKPVDKAANINTIENDIQLFPNPYSDKLIVSLETDPIQFLKLEVFNSHGKHIESRSIDKQKLEINLEYLNPGIYYFNFFDDQNILLETKKVIKSY
ncbi:T9SS type A sorting domain-containing protein [Crocinitomicaceae bacterium]|nr:T9SS type A sorting domain-containing protein [Crocinitomicaceae bacterium]